VPDDTIQALKFNPGIAGQPTLLAAGSWDNMVRAKPSLLKTSIIKVV